VIAELERRRRAQLEEDGIDLAVYLGAPKKPAGPPPPKVLGRGNAAPTTPPRKLTAQERREEFVRLKQSGKFDA
jgi:hypothetical protein